MKTIGNIIWLILIGFWNAILYFLVGAVLYITVIGIPLGTQFFKIGKLMLWPFGKKISTHFDKHPIANIIWILLFGWETALGFLLAGIILCITIIGIPFGKQCFKLAQLTLMPFGASV
ncbi:MAG: YccF domain-containing protein [Clostridia bacterium]|nr:YccF domain-containing protein [Clostridia bacterium]